MVPEISPRNRRRLVWAGVLSVVVLVAWWMTLSEKTAVSAVDAPPIDALIMPGETHSQSLEAVAATLQELMRRLTSLERGAAAQRDERRLELEQLHRALMAEVQGADAARRTAATQELARLREEMAALGYVPPPAVAPPAAPSGQAMGAVTTEPAPPAATLSLPSGTPVAPDARAPAESAPAPAPRRRAAQAARQRSQRRSSGCSLATNCRRSSSGAAARRRRRPSRRASAIQPWPKGRARASGCSRSRRRTVRAAARSAARRSSCPRARSCRGCC
jgi:hypothetical protein